jgi:hypothetical protein
MFYIFLVEIQKTFFFPKAIILHGLLPYNRVSFPLIMNNFSSGAQVKSLIGLTNRLLLQKAILYIGCV